MYLISRNQTASLALWLRRPPRERKIPGSNPACDGIFSGSSHTSDLKTGTPVTCQAPDVIGSVLGLVGPVSVYCDWVRWKVWPATSISMWQHVKLSEQVRPWDTLACCWDVKQPTYKPTSKLKYFCYWHCKHTGYKKHGKQICVIFFRLIQCLLCSSSPAAMAMLHCIAWRVVKVRILLSQVWILFLQKVIARNPNQKSGVHCNLGSNCITNQKSGVHCNLWPNRVANYHQRTRESSDHNRFSRSEMYPFIIVLPHIVLNNFTFLSFMFVDLVHTRAHAQTDTHIWTDRNRHFKKKKKKKKDEKKKK